MVRVAGLKRRADMGLQMSSPDGLTPREVLAKLGDRTATLVDRHARCFLEDVGPKLDGRGHPHPPVGRPRRRGEGTARRVLREQDLPGADPARGRPGAPVPVHLRAVAQSRRPGARRRRRPERFARVKVPNNVPRFVVVSQSAVEAEFLPLEDLIAAHLEMLFPGMQVVEHHLFRVTRNADFEVEEDRDEDLLQALERELMRRRFGPAVRLEVEDDIDDAVVDLLVNEIDVEIETCSACPGCSTSVRCGRSTTSTVPRSRTVRSSRPPTRASPRARRRSRCSRPCATATCSSTTRTSRSRPACSASSSRRPPTRTCWRSSRRSTAPPATRRSSTR